jgi:hypothetical protein
MESAGPFWKRLLWMVGIWALSVITLAIVAFIIRVILRA